MATTRSIGARPDATRGTTAVEVRKGFLWLFSQRGVLPGAASPLVTGTGGWAYSVGRAGLVTGRGDSDGVHLWSNDGAVSVGAGGVGTTVAAAPGSGLSRIDIVYALHPSAGENADTTSEPTIAVAVGTAASSPTAPSIPSGALELARNVMTAAATSTNSAGNSITQTAPMAQVGGATPFLLMERNTAATIPHGSQTVVTTWTSSERGGGMADHSAGVVTIPRAGRYRVTFGGNWAAAASGARRIDVLANGTTVVLRDEGPGTAAMPTWLARSRTVRLAANATLVLRAFQTSGASVAIGGDNDPLYLQVEYVGP